MNAVIRTSGLTKHYGQVRALDGLDLTVEPGQAHGFLGPNGAGKSTTMRLMLGLDNGSGKIRGIFLQGNEAVRPIFEEYLKPFNYLGVKTVSILNTERNSSFTAPIPPALTTRRVSRAGASQRSS